MPLYLRTIILCFIATVKSNRKKFWKTLTLIRFNNNKNQWLIFVGSPKKDRPKGQPFRLIDYLKLIDWTDPILYKDNDALHPKNVPLILSQLNIEAKHWLHPTRNIENPYAGYFLDTFLKKIKHSETEKNVLKSIPGLIFTSDSIYYAPY